MDRSRKGLTKSSSGEILAERTVCMKSRLCSCFPAYNFGKNLCENDIMTYARHESPSSSVVREPDRCTEGHGFDSRRELRFFLCPTLVTC